MRQNWRGGKWDKVVYRQTKIVGFSNWSTLVDVEKDLKLSGKEQRSDYYGLWSWLKKNVFWKKCAVLKVVASPGTQYRVGVYSNSYVCKISPIICN